MERAKAAKKSRSTGGQPPPATGRFYKIGEVCAMTDTQPYVLRFWESEFPVLAPRKSRSGQRLYEKKDVDLVLQIKKLLYDEEYTIAGARKRLEELGFTAAGGGAGPGDGAEERAPRKAPSRRQRAADLARLRKELLAIRKILES